MQVMSLVGLLLLTGGSIGISAWIASRLSRSWLAFSLAWVLTPVCMLVGTLLLMPLCRMMTPANNDGTWVIMVPIYGVGLGVPSAIVAAIVVSNRRKRTRVSPRQEPAT